MIHYQKLLLVLSAPLMALPASAAISPDSLFAEKELQQVVVTGTRTPKTLLSTPVLTQLISSADIKKADATNIKDLLQTVLPGVEFSYAQNQMVHLNFSGFGGQSVLILVDGERLAGETMDDVDFSRLSMENVDHIEIVKGAASALYGSNANGGVINIITKDRMKKFGAQVDARVGSKHGDQRYNLSLENGGDSWGNRLTVGRTILENYDVENGPDPIARVVSTIYGEKTWNVNDEVQYRPLSNLKLTAHGGYFFRQVDRDYATPERYRDLNGGLRGRWAITSSDVLDASYNFDEYDKSSFLRQQKRDIRSYSDVQNSIRLLYTHSFGKSDLTFGSDYLHDYLLNTKLNGTYSQDCFDIFGQYDWNISRRWEIVTALRYDYFSDHHQQRLTPKISIRHTPLEHFNVRFGYGMGFRAPTLKEKYYDFDMVGIWIIKGNPDLVPETSHNFNFSLEYTPGHYDFVVNGYCNLVRNKITSGNPYYTVDNPNMPYLPYVNLRRFNVAGFEASARSHWDCGISARLSYAFVHEDVLKDNDDNSLASPYLPSRKHSITGHIDWDHTFSKNYGMNISLDGRWLSGIDNNEFVDYYDVTKGVRTVHYPAYSIFKIMMQNRIGKHVSVQLSVDNLFNYKPDYHYLNAPMTDGTIAYAGVTINF